MSRFRKLSQIIWCCQYHIVFVPKYRFRILTGEVAHETERCIRAFVDQQKDDIVKLNVQIDHVHLFVMVPPKVSISKFVGTLKGRTSILIFNKFRKLKNKPYWGNHFWSRGYCVDTVGLDTEMIRKYVKVSRKRRGQTGEARTIVLSKNVGGNTLCLFLRQSNLSPFRG